MSTSWQSACVSLDDSLTQIHDSLGQLRAAKTVNVDTLIGQLASAAKAAQTLRTAVSSSMPEATWQTREDLEGLLRRIDRVVQARARLLALATELERGSIVHRRAVRANLLTQLRDKAVEELRSQADGKEEAPSLPGPEASEWIDWACALKEPEDSQALESLRHWFANLDNFIANLEPGMWVVQAGSTV
jgi:hypothetical protein